MGVSISSWRCNARRAGAVLCRTALLWSLSAAAQESDHAISLRVGLIHTDNIELADKGFEESQDVVELSPSFAFARETSRLDMALNYRAQGFFYEESERDQVFHQLGAEGTVQILPNRFFFRANAVYDQTIIDPTQSYFVSNVSVSENRTDAALLELSPFVLLGGSSTSGIFEIVKEKLDYREQAIQDVVLQAVNFELRTDRESGAVWAIDYGYEEYDYEDELLAQIKYQHFETIMGVYVSRGVRLFTLQGIENDFRKISDESLEEHYWEVGIGFEPSPRSLFEIAGGERMFGDTARLIWTQAMRRGAFSMSYRESPYSLARDLLSNPQQIDESIGLDDMLNVAGDTDVFIDKAWTTNFDIAGARTMLSIEIFSESREGKVDAQTGVELEGQDERLRGFNVDLRRTLNAVGSVVLYAGKANARYETDGRRGYNRNAELRWERRMGRGGTLGLAGIYSKRTGDIGGNYREHRVEARYGYVF